MSASVAFCAGAMEIHYRIPQCLLGLSEKADSVALDGAGIEAWLEYEHEAMRYGVDPDLSREDLTPRSNFVCGVFSEVSG